MSSIIVKERERERDFDDSRSVRTTRTANGRTYTTVRRYVDANNLPDEEVEDETTRIVIRERRRDDSPRDNVEYRIVHRETTDRGRDDRSDRESYRIVHRRRSRSSSSSSSSEHETTVRIDREETKSVRSKHDDVVTVRERDRSPSVRSPYGLEKYSKSTEYFSRPEVIPIIINNQAPRPIVIREQAPRQQIVLRREEPSYELVQRRRSRSSSHSSERRRHRDDEDYYYERRTRDYGDGRGKQTDYERERRRRRPHSGDRSAYSDDDVVYIRREREVSRSNSPRDRRHIAEGAIAGIAASEIIRHRRKRNGENPGSRVGSAIGYGALGGVGAGVLSRVTKSRERSPSWERERGRDSRRFHSRSRSGSRSSRHRSRSKSISKKQAVAGGVALAGLAAVAYAVNKRNKNKSDGDRRSRSRTRRSSVGAYSDDGRTATTEGTAMDPKHRNQTIARAGLAGAALAGLNEARKRSQSRHRSKSRVREGIPIVAAGLGSAALGGLYEHVKKKKEERARSRSVSVGPSRTRGVEYGGDPIYTSEPGRRRSSARGRRDYSSSDVSPDRRHRSRSGRSKSRERQLAETAAVAGVAGVAAHEATRRRERKRAERERQRQAEDAAAGQQYSPSTEVPGSFYPSTNSFPPPPMGGYEHGGFIPQHPNRSYTEPPYPTQGGPPPAAYNPAQWGPSTGPTLPQEEAYHQEQYATARGDGHDYYRGHPQDPNNMV